MSCSAKITGLTVITSLVCCGQALALSEGKEYANSTGMRFVRIEAGSFMMGQDREADGKSITLTYGDRQFMGGELDEQPVHKVIISKPFYMSATEVTNSQYEQFEPNHRRFRGVKGLSNEDDEAVVNVTWHEAVAFCEWLSKKDKRPYRLPTEAEWEYACRAGTTTRFNTGDDLPEIYQKSQKHKSRPDKVSTRVAVTPPNAWGLYDMHGNVEEWCYDWYGPYESGKQTDPVGRKTGLWKVVRGGSHNVYLKSLRSANRMSTLPEDKHWLIGFRVVQGELPAAKPLPQVPPPLNARNVSRKPCDWSKGPDAAKPYFEGPIPFVRKPNKPKSVPFFFHNHLPSITWCDNGDLLAAWFTCARERGREVAVVAARFRRKTRQWDEASEFFNARDRNMHGIALYNDGNGRIFHLNGLGTDGWWSKLALTQRISTDSGATWSYPRLVDPEHGPYIAHMGISRTREGHLIFPADAPGGTGLYLSRDKGQTWQMVTDNHDEANIRGTHAPVVQLANGALMAFGRGKPIDDRTPMSLSKDMGKTWTYLPTDLPPISGGQRAVLLRLREGSILYVGFTDTADFEPVILDQPRPRTLSEKGILVMDAAGTERRVYGMFAAVTFDEGMTWPLRKLVTAGGPPRKLNGQAWTQDFIMDDTHAEPLGYLAVTQSPDNVIHLISSGLHYRFNLTWLKTPAKFSDSK